MIQTKYNRNLKKIAYPEISGMVLCLTGATFIGFEFIKLDTPFLKCTGIVAILLLLTLTVISLLSLRRLQHIGDVNQPYAIVLKNFAIQKIRFHTFQRINIVLSYLLLVAIIILISKIFGGRHITGNGYFGPFSFTIGYLFMSFYSRWVLKYYRKILRQAEELLLELAS